MASKFRAPELKVTPPDSLKPGPDLPPNCQSEIFELFFFLELLVSRYVNIIPKTHASFTVVLEQQIPLYSCLLFLKFHIEFDAT